MNAGGERTCAGAMSYVESLPKELTCATVVLGSEIKMVIGGEQQQFRPLDAEDPGALNVLTACREAILRMAEAPVLK
jgi:hypothetical protein